MFPCLMDGIPCDSDPITLCGGKQFTATTHRMQHVYPSTRLVPQPIACPLASCLPFGQLAALSPTSPYTCLPSHLRALQPTGCPPTMYMSSHFPTLPPACHSTCLPSPTTCLPSGQLSVVYHPAFMPSNLPALTPSSQKDSKKVSTSSLYLICLPAATY
jgi:hypothetical protein